LCEDSLPESSRVSHMSLQKTHEQKHLTGRLEKQMNSYKWVEVNIAAVS